MGYCNRGWAEEGPQCCGGQSDDPHRYMDEPEIAKCNCRWCNPGPDNKCIYYEEDP